jgi:hypothetical protein
MASDPKAGMKTSNNKQINALAGPAKSTRAITVARTTCVFRMKKSNNTQKKRNEISSRDELLISFLLKLEEIKNRILQGSLQ